MLELDSRFLHAEDLRDPKTDEWRDFRLTVAEVIPKATLKDGKDDAIDHQILRFEETDKMLVLTSRCNIRILKACYGSELVGKAVTLYPACGNWFGERDLLAIRVRSIAGKPVPKLQKRDLGRDLTKE